MAAERAIKLRLEVEASQYTKAMADASQSAEKLAAAQDLAAKKVDHAAAVQKTASERVKVAEENLKKVRSDSTSTAEQQSKAEQDLTKAKLDETVASQNLRDAERGLKDAKAETTAEAEKQATVMGRFNGFMERNAESVKTAAQLMVGFGGAVTGVGLAAIKTGIEYNTLQQTTRKALTTLTGSAEEANAQMDKLDAFAKTSPFSKSTFITAQQQMLAFGIESRKVIPYLEAINDAVAASGGSSQQIGEISYIMAQISAASKITATDLMQFGQRGIDAATLIGSQMGMTGTQIREAITKGALGADEALDALTAGMAQKFEGAAAGVKDTMGGALDRLGASWREFGAMLASPLVNQEGGGILVDLTNKAADAANAFRGLPDPIRNTALAIVGLTSVGALGAGSILLAAPKIRATTTALRGLASQMPKTTGFMKIMGGAAGAATVAISALMVAGSYKGGESSQSIQEMTRHIEDLGRGAWATDTVFKNISFAPGKELDFQGFIKQISDPTPFQKFKGFMGDLRAGTGDMFNADWRNDMQRAKDELKGFDAAIAELALTDMAAVSEAFAGLNLEAGGTQETAQALLETMPGLRGALVGIASDAGLATDDATLLGLALGTIKTSSDQTKEALKSAGYDIEALQEGIDEAASSARKYALEWKNAIIDTAVASTTLLGAFDEVADKGTVTAKKLLRTLENNAKDYQKWSGNIVDIQKRLSAELPAEMQAAGVAMVQELVDAGPESAAAAALLVKMTEEELKKAVESSAGFGSDAGNAFAENLDAARVPELQVGTTDATRATQTLQQFVQAAGDSYGPWKIDADGTTARREADGTVVSINKKTGNITIDGENWKALSAVASAVSVANNSTGTITVTAKVARQQVNSAAQNAMNIIKQYVPGFKAAGGRADVGQGLPALAGGGRLPSTGLGTDQILGINSAGQPTAWVDDREWIINRRSSDKYDSLLDAINQDSPGVQHLAGFAGGGSAGFAPVGVPASVAGSASVVASSFDVSVVVENPWTGQEVQAVVRDVAVQEIRGNQRMVSAGSRAGRRP